MTISATQVQAGGKLNLNYTIRNSNATAAGAFSVQVCLGTTTYGTQTPIQTFQINSLAGLGSSAGPREITIPANTTPGDYWVTLFIDSANNVAESNEGNNILSTTPVKLKVTAPPPTPPAQADLTGDLPMTISATQVQAGGKLNLNYTIKNNSATAAGAFSAQICLGTSAYGTQTPIQTFQINSLAGQGSSTGPREITIPVNTAPGDYWVTLFIDSANNVAESKEDNNILSTDPVKLKVTEPPSAPVQQGEPGNLSVLWLPSPNFNSRPRPASEVIDTIVIHTTQGNYESDKNTLRNPEPRLNDPPVGVDKRVSAHYLISPTGEITQSVELSKRAWHATYYNDQSIGIEMAGYAEQSSTWTSQNLAALENLVAYLVTKYASIPIVHPPGDASTYPDCRFTEKGLIAHSQIQPGTACNGFSIKSDPGPYFPWATFVQNVQTKTGATPPPTGLITAAIDQRLLDLIDTKANQYYNASWNLSLEQFKAWIATIAKAEGGRGGYGAHSQYGGGHEGDAFDHTNTRVGASFRFSTGLGPFQLDRFAPEPDDWEHWPSIDKLNPEKAVDSVLRTHFKEYPAGSTTLDSFSATSRWLAVDQVDQDKSRQSKDVAAQWKSVTGEEWNTHKTGRRTLDWSTIKSKLALNASTTAFRYESNVQSIGIKQWDVKAADGFKTDAQKSISFEGPYETWLITARPWEGQELFKYYYAFRPDAKIEAWVYDNSSDTANRFRYAFVREYGMGPFPEGRTSAATAGITLNRPALSLDSTTTASKHPADTDPPDFILSIQEVLSFVTAWLRNPRIDTFNDALSAVLIFIQSGGPYIYDTAKGWVAAPSVGKQSVGSSRSTQSLSGGSATRQMPGTYSPGVEFEVKVTVTPPAGTALYVLEEQLPAGWTAKVDLPGTFSAATSKVQFLGVGSSANTLAYKVTPPAGASGPAAISGQALFGSGGAASTTVNVGGSGTITYNAPPATYTLTLIRSPQNGGTIQSQPSPGADGKYSAGTPVTLTATPSPGSGYVFSSWAGVDSPNGNTAQIRMSGDKIVTATFTLLQNHSPVAVNDSATTTKGNAVTIAVTTNDSDQDADTLQVSNVTQGNSGSVVIVPPGSVTYTPNPAFTGTDSFTYTINDGHSGTATAMVSVTVSAPPAPTSSGIASFLWAKQVTSGSYHNGTGIAVDSAGNAFVAGFFNGSVTLGTIQLNSAGEDILVAKYDATGNVLWAKQAGSSWSEQATAITTDSSGNVYVTGHFNAITTASFDGIQVTSSELNNVFVAKYNSNGNILWAKNMGGIDSSGIATDRSGNVYVAGYLSGTAKFGATQLSSGGGYDLFVLKLDTSGSVVWAKSAGGTSDDWAYGLAVDGTDNLFITGIISGSAKFGAINLATAGAFVSKLDSIGNVLWAKQAGAQSGKSIAVDTSGNSYMVGLFQGTVSFGSSSLTSAGNRDVVLIKYDPSGNVIWAKAAGGTSDDFGLGVAVDDSGNSYIAGQFRGAATFGITTLTCVGSAEVFLAKYDPSGNAMWAIQVNGNNYDGVSAIAVDDSGNC